MKIAVIELNDYEYTFEGELQWNDESFGTFDFGLGPQKHENWVQRLESAQCVEVVTPNGYVFNSSTPGILKYLGDDRVKNDYWDEIEEQLK